MIKQVLHITVDRLKRETATLSCRSTPTWLCKLGRCPVMEVAFTFAAYTRRMSCPIVKYINDFVSSRFRTFYFNVRFDAGAYA